MPMRRSGRVWDSLGSVEITQVRLVCDASVTDVKRNFVASLDRGGGFGLHGQASCGFVRYFLQIIFK
jgi:hypothetical protein